MPNTPCEDSFDCFDRIELSRRTPVQSITSIKYLSKDRVEQTLAPGRDFAWPLARPVPTQLTPIGSWPEAYGVRGAIRVEYIAA
jgi:hypothetical protein